MEFAIVSLGIFTGLCTVACFWSVSVAREARAGQRFPVKRLNAAEAELADLRDRMERLHAFVKRLNARDASQAARDSRKGATVDEPGDESPAEWKARMRQKLFASQLGGETNGG